MSLFFHRRTNGIVNVKMVITEEKILSNIDKIQKLINPNSKKQIVKLEEDSYFKDLVESVKNYLLEYPKKNCFPTSVYDAAYSLVEFSTNQFEENTKTVEELIRKREKNIKLGNVLRDATKVVKARPKNWKEIVNKLEPKYSPDVAEALRVIGESEDIESEKYKKAEKLIDVKINNLETNLYIEIDMERIEDASKALSYIGIEIAEALKYIPAPEKAQASEKVEKVSAKSQIKSNEEIESIQTEQEEVKPISKVSKNVISSKAEEIDAELEEESQEAEDYEFEEEWEDIEEQNEEQEESSVEEAVEQDQNNESVDVAVAESNDYSEKEYIEETRFEKKPSLWQRIKNSKIVRTINFILNIRVVLDYPALPDVDTNK